MHLAPESRCGEIRSELSIRRRTCSRSNRNRSECIDECIGDLSLSEIQRHTDNLTFQQSQRALLLRLLSALAMDATPRARAEAKKYVFLLSLVLVVRLFGYS